MDGVTGEWVGLLGEWVRLRVSGGGGGLRVSGHGY